MLQAKKLIRTSALMVVATILSVSLMAFAGTIKPQEAQAASFNYSSCIEGPTYNGHKATSAVMSVVNACNLCQGDSLKNARGVLWFNDSWDSPEGNTVNLGEWTAEALSDSLNIVIWGAVFSCGSTSTNDNWGRYVWIGEKDQMYGEGTKIENMQNPSKFFDLTKSAGGEGMYGGICRGVLPGAANTWSNMDKKCTTSVPNSYSLPNVINFKPKTFYEEAMKAGACVDDTTGGGVTKKKCTMQVSVNRCFDGEWGKYKNLTNTRSGKCYGDNSEIILIAPVLEEKTPGGNGEFSSKSKVRASTGGSSQSTAWDVDAATLEVQAGTDGNVTAYFQHQLHYVPIDTDSASNYNKPSTSYTITTDESGTQSGTWTTPNPGNQESTSEWVPTTEIAVNISLGTASEKTVCSKISYDPDRIKWDDADPRQFTKETGPGSTKACIKVKKADPEPEEGVGKLEFWSRSYVEAVAQNDVTSGINAETEQYKTGQKVTVSLSTDYNSGQARFRHTLDWKMTFTDGFNSGDEIDYEGMCTNWSTDPSSHTGASGSGEYCVTSQNGSEIVVPLHGPYTINLPSKDQLYSKEEKITYSSKVISLNRIEKMDGPCDEEITEDTVFECAWDPARYTYYVGAGSGSGDSAAKIEFLRPSDPDPNDMKSWSDPSTAGVESGPMYTGESGKMYWSAKAKAWNARKIVGYREIAFEVKANQGPGGIDIKGNYAQMGPGGVPVRSTTEPCPFWENTRFPGKLRTSPGPGCDTVKDVTYGSGMPSGGASDYSPDPTVSFDSQPATVFIPNFVADKYCNSLGFHWRYYWGKMISNGGSDGAWSWTATSQHYWINYDAACRTIAKKPSLEAWNGGVSTPGGIKTLLNHRYNNGLTNFSANGAILSIAQTGVGKSPSGSVPFGSWAEDLNAVGGSTQTFGSGASLALGKTTNEAKYYPLTIANAGGTYGGSGIPDNSELFNRLKAYFKQGNFAGDLSSDVWTTSIDDLYGAGNAGVSKVYYSSGELEIEQDIFNKGSFGSIYDLPQKVIYTTGDVHIKQGVKQIDAWIITDGSIYTCEDYDYEFPHDNLVAKVSDLSANPECSNSLTFNGPVFAKNMITTRTYGSDITVAQDPPSGNNGDKNLANGVDYDSRAASAEIFNLSGDSYIWGYVQAGRYTSSYNEAYSRELPPRY